MINVASIRSCRGIEWPHTDNSLTFTNINVTIWALVILVFMMTSCHTLRMFWLIRPTAPKALSPLHTWHILAQQTKPTQGSEPHASAGR